MQNTDNVTSSVDRPTQTVSAKVPADWRAMLNVVSAKRGEASVSETLRTLIRDAIEEHYPGRTSA